MANEMDVIRYAPPYTFNRSFACWPRDFPLLSFEVKILKSPASKPYFSVAVLASVCNIPAAELEHALQLSIRLSTSSAGVEKPHPTSSTFSFVCSSRAWILKASCCLQVVRLKQHRPKSYRKGRALSSQSRTSPVHTFFSCQSVVDDSCNVGY